MLGRRAAVSSAVAILAVTGAGAAYAATHGSNAAPSKKPSGSAPARIMPAGHCPHMGSTSSTSGASASDL